MGGLLSKFSWYKSNKDVRILMCGLDAAGKTTILYKLKLGDIVTTIPTIGFNVETVEYKGVNFTTWDVSGRSGIRALWRHYTVNCDGIIFVMDSTDRDRVSECHDELHRMLEDKDLKETVPLLVFANKQDVSTAMNADEIKCHLKLEGLQRSYHVQTCSAITEEEGLYEGLDWLQCQVTSNDVKETVIAPVKDSVIPPLSRIRNSLTNIRNYLWPSPAETSS
ncbi:uncharacterized protein [Dysidea avara]|uniref:uncharacterized protein n=1 Tax=Dysidea avara TaxID=196820 RepID=UPI00331AE2D2